jgi:hypothetical protein
MEATPVEEDALVDVGSPAPDATPELGLAPPADDATGQAADELFTGETTPDDVVVEVEAALNNLAVCLNDGCMSSSRLCSP